MAKGPRYHLPFRRRREGKTNYHRRLVLVRSRRNRLVIRCSLKHTIVQVSESHVKGDKVIAVATSKHLLKDYGWKYNTGNLPASYLSGYLCGLRAKKAGVQDAILDVGILVHDNRVKAAFKGFLDSGINIPHDQKWFGKALDERVTGKHIAEYAKLLSTKNPDAYKKIFAETLKNKADPTKYVDEVKKIKDAITKKN